MKNVTVETFHWIDQYDTDDSNPASCDSPECDSQLRD